MQEISDLLRKRNLNDRGFLLRSVRRSCRDRDLSSREITNSKFQNVVREAVEKVLPQSAFTFSELTIETLQQGVKYVQS